jgi:NADPH2:quinone reductase
LFRAKGSKPYLDHLVFADNNFTTKQIIMLWLVNYGFSIIGRLTCRSTQTQKEITMSEPLMKAIALTRYLPVSDPQAFIDIKIERPQPKGHDILVAVKAVSINPVDVKVRSPKDKVEQTPRVIGWDSAGIVEAVGPLVTLFKPGDAVWYAGDITRSGSNQEFHLVDERIVGSKPKSLTYAQAAAMPLTSITAWEAMFDRLRIDPNSKDKGQTILIIGGAGGVGSIAIQLAKRAGLIVIATASRSESVSWVKSLGADHVVNHREDLVEQVRAAGFHHVDHIALLNDMRHWAAAVELIRPQGGIVCIDDTHYPMPMEGMKTKAASLHWELMFTRPMLKTPDMIKQHELLSEVARAVDAGEIKTTLTTTLSPITAATLREAHALVESGAMIGKIVVANFH